MHLAAEEQVKDWEVMLANSPPEPPPFRFQERRGRLDWRGIQSIDIGRVLSMLDLEQLQKLLPNITFAAVRSSDVAARSDRELVKLFELSQLSIEYSVHVQGTLHAHSLGLEQQLASIAAEASRLQDSMMARDKEMEAMRKEIRRRRQLVQEYKEALAALRKRGSGSTTVVATGNGDQSEAARLRQEVADLRSQLEAALAENSKLTGDLRDMSEKCGEWKGRAESAERQLAHAREAERRALQEAAAARAAREEALSQLAAKQREVDQLRAERDRAIAEMEEWKRKARELEELRRKVEELRREVDAAERRAEEAKREAQQWKERYEEERQLRMEREETIRQLQSELQAATARIRELELELEALRRRIADLERRVEELEAIKKEQEEEIERLRALLRDRDATIAELRRRLESDDPLAEEVRRLRQRIQDLEDEIERLKRIIQERDTTIGEKDAYIQELLAEIERLKALLRQSQVDLNAERQVVRQRDRRIEELLAEIARLRAMGYREVEEPAPAPVAAPVVPQPRPAQSPQPPFNPDFVLTYTWEPLPLPPSTEEEAELASSLPTVRGTQSMAFAATNGTPCPPEWHSVPEGLAGFWGSRLPADTQVRLVPHEGGPGEQAPPPSMANRVDVRVPANWTLPITVRAGALACSIDGAQVNPENEGDAAMDLRVVEGMTVGKALEAASGPLCLAEGFWRLGRLLQSGQGATIVRDTEDVAAAYFVDRTVVPILARQPSTREVDSWVDALDSTKRTASAPHHLAYRGVNALLDERLAPPRRLDANGNPEPQTLPDGPGLQYRATLAGAPNLIIPPLRPDLQAKQRVDASATSAREGVLTSHIRHAPNLVRRVVVESEDAGVAMAAYQTAAMQGEMAVAQGHLDELTDDMPTTAAGHEAVAAYSTPRLRNRHPIRMAAADRVHAVVQDIEQRVALAVHEEMRAGAPDQPAAGGSMFGDSDSQRPSVFGGGAEDDGTTIQEL